jgi:hypothetical protein
MVGRQGRPPAVLSTAAAGEWGKMERGRGDPFPALTLDRGGSKRRIGGGGQREAAALGAAARWSSGRLVVGRLRCGEARGWWCWP